MEEKLYVAVQSCGQWMQEALNKNFSRARQRTKFCKELRHLINDYTLLLKKEFVPVVIADFNGGVSVKFTGNELQEKEKEENLKIWLRLQMTRNILLK